MFTALLNLFAASWLGVGQSPASALGDPEMSCAPHAVAVACALLGRQIDDDELSAAFGGRLEGPHSFDDLRGALCNLGHKTSLVVLDARDPQLASLPLIIAIARPTVRDMPYHFVVLYRRKGDVAQVLDYPHAPVWAQIVTLSGAWDGGGLYVARTADELPPSKWRFAAVAGGAAVAGAACVIVAMRMLLGKRKATASDASARSPSSPDH